MGKGREPQIILKTHERNLVFELGAKGKFVVKSSTSDEKRVFLEDDKLEGRGQERRLGDGPSARRAAAGRHYFLTE
jgi:hypothetical protein